MSLIVHEVALELIVELRTLIPSITRHDANLARQLRRCASSIVLNIAEGEYSDLTRGGRGTTPRLGRRELTFVVVRARPLTSPPPNRVAC